MKNNLPLLVQMRKKGNDTTIISALVSKIIQDIAKEKLGHPVGKLEVTLREKSIGIQCPSSLIAGELRIYSEVIKKASQAKLLKLGYVLPDETRIYIR
ncbi:hypothetical protein LAT59_04490 [Candidatus Gracilibacteria bacterium]|nr:hypothetical protein [Candidatus Gracilibacteria bacterium]